MTASPHSVMDRYAVIGHPVEHSLSPRIHALFAKQTGQHLVYDRLECAPGRFIATVEAFAANEGGHAQTRWNTLGCNITVPFKFEAFACAQRHSPRAALAQAANTLRFDSDAEGGWWADNTDGVGLVRDIEDHAQWGLRGQRVLVIGAGGAAAGILGPLIQGGPKELVLLNRTRSKADQLVARHAALAAAHEVVLRGDDLGARDGAYDIVINATAASLAGASIGLPAAVCKREGLAIDLMYGPAAQPFLDWARAAGAQARDGLGMLVEQAAESFHIWRNIRPHTTAVLQEIRDYLHHRH